MKRSEKVEKNNSKSNLLVSLNVNVSEDIKKGTNAGPKANVTITCIGKTKVKVDVSKT